MFLGNSTLLALCVPGDDGAATDRLLRPQFGMHRFELADPPTVELHLGHGDWIRLLRANGLRIEDLIELRPPDEVVSDCPFVTADWAGVGPAKRPGGRGRSEGVAGQR